MRPAAPFPLSRPARRAWVLGLFLLWPHLSAAQEAARPAAAPPSAPLSGSEVQEALPDLWIDPVDAPRIASVTALSPAPQPFEALPGGAATHERRDARAFATPAPALGMAALDAELGRALFDKIWVAAPATTRASDGLGPMFNARACSDCHPGNGRGHPPGEAGPGRADMGMALHLSVPADPARLAPDLAAIAGWIATAPEPVYGRQLQDRALTGMAPEGQIALTWVEEPVTLAGGEVVSLRRPRVGVTDLAQGPLAAEVMLSARVAPQLVGLGLLEAVPAADILALADPEDRDGDGISGRAALASVPGRGLMLGRFGAKAAAPDLIHQAATAFSNDLGLSTPLRPDPYGDCSVAETACRSAATGETPDLRDGREVSGESLGLVSLYLASLGVPPRRGAEESAVTEGKAAFYAAGCPACHHPAFVTGRLGAEPWRSFQLIWPYSDLLLHDMGEGLADNRPEGVATGREWRTAPLWGIGLTRTVTGTETYLHDGRARSLMEAVLWHGGEAQAARDSVVSMPKATRNALIRYLESL